MKKSKPKRTQTEAEIAKLKLSLGYKKFKIIVNSFFWIFLFFLFFLFGYLSIKNLSGKLTQANIIIDQNILTLDIIKNLIKPFNSFLLIYSVLITILFVVILYILYNRIRAFGKYRTEFELQYNKDRTSSNLTPHGTTKEEDRE